MNAVVRLSVLTLLAALSCAQAASETPLVVDYPLAGSVFPPDFAAPTFLWRDANSKATAWEVEIRFSNGAPNMRLNVAGEPMKVGEIDPRAVGPTNKPPTLTPEQAAARTWQPDAATWTAIKDHSKDGNATLTFTGRASAGDKAVLSRGSVQIRTSTEPVGAPIFYRDVPLMPSETEKGVIKPLASSAIPLIAWRLRNVAESKSRVVMEGIYSCANCHSASLDGKTLGMDLDGPLNDKGLYALFPIQPKAAIRSENVIAWSTYRGKLGGKLRVGFMSQVSPDSKYVITTIGEPDQEQTDYQRRRQPRDLIQNYYVANFTDYRFLQVFFPTRGILAWLNRDTGKLEPLPGADDPKYVHTNAVWSPDGKYLVFARAEARDAYPSEKRAEFANDPNETQIQYDLYRIPFNGGKGGTPEPIAGASRNGMSNSFPKVSPDGKWIVFVQARNGQLMRPDSKLYIVPASGGKARQMSCNTPLMNSWHSFSPNGRWLVFSSKSRSPYTQMFLTHIDENGNDTPPILIENSTAANRAVNIPEFINIAPDGLLTIDAQVTQAYRVIDGASALAKKGDHKAAIAEWRKAMELEPGEASVHFNLANALSEVGSKDEAVEQYKKALELSPDHAEAHNNLGNLLASMRRTDEAITHFEAALKSNPEKASAQSNLGIALAQRGRLLEAIPHFEKALEIDPEQADVRTNLAVAMMMTGNLDGARPHLEKAVQLKPASVEGHFLLGRLLAAESKFPEAIPHFEEAVKLSGEREPAMLDLLGGCYAQVGRAADAIRVAKKALAIAEASGNGQMIEALKGRIADYESLAKQ